MRDQDGEPGWGASMERLGMVDIHSHVLWGLDDGAQSMRMAVEILRAAGEAGVEVVVATPHCGVYWRKARSEEVARRVEELRRATEEAGVVGVAVLPGGEVYLDVGVGEMVAGGVLPVLGSCGARAGETNGQGGGAGGSEAPEGDAARRPKRHVLVELPMLTVPEWTKDVLFDIVARGFVPVLAHPERNHELSQRLDLLFELIEMGCLVQLEAGSLVGQYGPIAEAAAWRIIEHDMCHFFASDAHGPWVYRDVVPAAVEAARERLGEARVRALFRNNAAAMLEGRPLEVPPARAPRGRRAKWRLF